MKNRGQTYRRLGYRLLLAVCVLGLSAGTGFAQVSRPIPKAYVSKGTVRLPVQIEEFLRPQIQEVRLYIREGPQGSWSLKERAPGTQTMFTFRSNQEGEYWFSLAYVDRAGRIVPADITREPPGLIVVVDNTPPEANVHILGVTPKGQQIHCDVRDANSDPSKTGFFYQTCDQVWRRLDPVGGEADIFCIPEQARITGMIRVVACDLAGNTTTRMFHLASHVNNSPIPAAKVSATAGTGSNRDDKLVTASSFTDFVTAAPREPAVIWEKTPAETIAIPSKPKPAPFAPISPEGRGARMTEPPVLGYTGPATAPALPANRQLINNPHTVLNYQIEQTGISGVGRVEIWCTRDLGNTWQKLDEDVNRRGQVEVDLPGEGVYGISVVVANGRGFGANPPKPGDAPDYWVEVDTTKPQVELLGVESNLKGDDGSLHITWRANDKNLDTDPVDLFYATDRMGPWLLIAKGLKNDGLYRWVPTADVGAHVFVRLTVHDKAGNSASSDSLQPVLPDDLSRPRGRVVSIVTLPRHSALAPSGN